MAFKFHQTQGNIIPGNEYLPVSAITPVIGLLLTVSGGQLAIASGTAQPSYVCLCTQDNAAVAGNIIPVTRVLPDMVFATTWSADAASIKIGDKVTISADGLEATATTGGTAEVVGMEGTGVGDTVYVRFPAGPAGPTGPTGPTGPAGG